MITRIAIALAALAAAAAVPAQDRPAEEELFGAPPPAAEAAPAPQAEPSPPVSGRDDAILGGGRAGPPAGVMTAAQENPLALGGMLYLRASTLWERFKPPSEWPLYSSNLLDVYVDTRPNDRVRAFALARTLWSPFVPAGLLPGVTPPGASLEPQVFLDQLWVNFDVGRRAFVTVGKQHVKWGVGRFWNPTDFLHPDRRNPLDVFDARVGTTMVKVHVPWEARGWNLYAIAFLDDPSGKGDGANTIGKVAGGARAEVVLGPAELGATALVRDGQRPRFGLDFSTGIWDLDVHGEVALRTSSDVQLWEEIDPAAPTVFDRYGKRSLDGITPQAVLGVSYAVNYSDEDAVRFGAEYFYNGAGYDDPHIYPWLQRALVLPGESNDYVPFYVGRHYAGAFALLAAPGTWNDHTFTLNVLANLSDGSATVRIDHSMVVNTYLTVESFLAGYVGTEGGEFRFALDVSKAEIGPPLTADLRTQPPVLSGGVALRVKL